MHVPPPSTFHVVVPNIVGTAVLVLGDNTMHGPVAALPRHIASKENFNVYIDNWDGHTDDLCAFLSHLLECNVYVRRMLWECCEKDESGCMYYTTVIVVDRLYADCSTFVEDSIVPAGMRWLQSSARVNWKPIHPECNLPAIISAFFNDESEEYRGRPLLRNAPWRLRKWISHTVQQVSEIAAVHHLEIVATKRTRAGSAFFSGFEPKIVQWQNGPQSTILRCAMRRSAELSVGIENSTLICSALFFKASIEAIHEGHRTRIVSRVFPHLVPRLLSSSSNSIVQIEIKELDNLPCSSDFMKALASMHKDSIEHVSCLLERGIPERTVLWVRKNIDNVLESQPLANLEFKKERERLKSKLVDIKRACDLVESCGFPDVLVHGDLDWGNVLQAQESSTVSLIDWACCCISHPLIDYLRVTKHNWEVIQEPDALEQYANAWLSEVSRENFDKALTVLPPVSFLILLIHYCEVFNHLEQESDRAYFREEVIKKGIHRVLKAVDEIPLYE